MLVEKKDNRAGFGAARFFVRGSSFLPLDRAAALRPRYNEYPERYPLDPAFPRAGRRGGSPAPLSTRGAVGGGEAPGGEGGPEDLIIVPPGVVFPGPRPREGGFSSGSQLPAGEVAGLGGACCADVGDTLRNSPQVPAAGGIRSFSSRRIARPFVITHIQYWSSNTVPSSVTDVKLTIFLADDNSVTLTALVPSGVPLDVWEGSNFFEPHAVAHDHYPNLLVPTAGKFIKIEWVNAGAAAVETMLTMSWKYL